MSLKAGVIRHIFGPGLWYHQGTMTHILDIPKDRKRINPARLCLLIAVTALLFMSVSAGFAETVVQWTAASAR
jgi:hypothetical protein